MNTKDETSLVSYLLTALLLAGCGAGQEPVQEIALGDPFQEADSIASRGIAQKPDRKLVEPGTAITAPTVIGEIIGAVVNMIMTVIDKMHEHDQDTALATLSEQIIRLDSDLRALENEVVNVTYIARRSEVISLQRDVDTQRAFIVTSINQHKDRKRMGLPSTSDDDVWRSAAALANPSYYTFAGSTAGSPDRFDQRMTLSTFLMAVDAWIALRLSNGKSWTPEAASDVRRFADYLDWIAATINSKIQCRDCYSSELICDEAFGKGSMADYGPRCIVVCDGSIQCTDSIRQITEVIKDYDCRRPAGTADCVEKPDIATRLATSLYDVARLRQIAAAWRGLLSP